MIGVGIGAIGAFALTRLLKGMLFGVETFDPATFLSMALGLTTVILLACFFPARRATRVDPVQALRYE